MRRFVFVLLAVLLLCVDLSAKQFMLQGKISNENLEPLAYAKVNVKNSTLKAESDAQGNYKLKLEEGRYELVVTMLGYEPYNLEIILDADKQQNFLLQKKTSSKEALVKATKKDRGEEIIRYAIEHKDENNFYRNNFSYRAYIKAVNDTEEQKDDKTKEKKSIFKIKRGESDSTSKNDSLFNSYYKDIMNMNMAEVVLKVDYQYPDQVKEAREAVKIRGNSESLFYLSTTEANFNVYDNLIDMKSVCQMPILSPLSYSGLMAYRYKILGIYEEKGRNYFKIRVTPVKTGNALVSGEIIVVDSSWTVVETHFTLPQHQMPEYNYFSVNQVYEQTETNVWVLQKQLFSYASKISSKVSKNGSTLVLYSNYDMNKNFSKKYFSNEISVTTQDAYEKDTGFWNTVRVEPLTEKEIKYIHYKDSVYNYTHTKTYLDSVDRKVNKIKILNILWFGQENRNSFKERYWFFSPLPSYYRPLNVGGARVASSFSYSKKFKNKKDVSVFPELSYGFLNNDFKWTLYFSHRYDAFRQGRFTLNTSNNFDFIFSGDAWVNMLRRSNIYQKRNISLNNSIELINGLYFNTEVEFARRMSVANMKLSSENSLYYQLGLDTVFGTVRNNDRPIDFESYDALYSEVALSYTPEQRYNREPFQKVVLGSKYPTFYFKWKRGWPSVLGSKINFDYVEVGAHKEFQLGLAGLSEFRVFYGQYLNTKDLRNVDYKWMVRGNPTLFLNNMTNMQALDSTFAIFQNFAEGHYQHNFNGSIINKIPFMKKTKITEKVGASFLIVPERNLRYVETYAGLFYPFRISDDYYRIGYFVVWSYANQFQNPIQLKFSLGHYNKRKNSWE